MNARRSLTTGSPGDVFAIPVQDRVLIYAPLHDFAAVVSRSGAGKLGDFLASSGLPAREGAEAVVDRLARHGSDLGEDHSWDETDLGVAEGDVVAGSPVPRGIAGEELDRWGEMSPRLRAVADEIAGPSAPAPVPKAGGPSPRFLGLLPTRSCNLACRYCGFWQQEAADRQMPIETARSAIDWYLENVADRGSCEAEIHFFGGEPFQAYEIVDFTYYYSRRRADEIGAKLRFEVATNGVVDRARAQWIADHLSTVVLSFDGPHDIQDRQRPFPDGAGTFDAVLATARVLSDGPTELCLRACVTADSVHRMEETADFFSTVLRPDTVCFETLQDSKRARSFGLSAPDPWQFAVNYYQARSILLQRGIEAVFAGAEIDQPRVSFCPVGSDSVIVSPEGELAACYLLPQEWRSAGLDMRLGAMSPEGEVSLSREALEAVRRLNVREYTGCDDCFCRWHCAGGCHVNHQAPKRPGDFDEVCVQTRLITLLKLFEAMGQSSVVQCILANPKSVADAVHQATDRLTDFQAHG